MSGRRLEPGGWLKAAVFALGLCVAGCKCSKTSDEEILRERIDAAQVHLYLAGKIAVLKADQSEDAKAAMTAITSALRALRGEADGDSPATTEEQPAPDISPTDLFVLAKSLYALKKEGEELLRSGDEKGMKPVLPLLFNPNAELADAFNLNLEHAILLTGLFALKFHPRIPVPVPAEILLYEAWMTEPESLMPGLQSFIRAERALVFGTNELCDLSAAQGRGIEAEQASIEQLAAVIQLSGARPNLDETEVKEAYGALRALTHGVSAHCYLVREEPDNAVEELDRTLQALEEAGIPGEQTALLRAYVAVHRGDQAKGKEYLQVAIDWPGTAADTKTDLVALRDKLSDDPNVFAKKLGKGWFLFYLGKIVVRHLDESGVFDELKETELVRTVRGFITATTRLGDEVKSAASPNALWEKVRGALPGKDEPRVTGSTEPLVPPVPSTQ